MRVIKTVMLLGTASLFTGCATMSKEQCLQADWHSIGYHDGQLGYTVSRLASHHEACAEVNIAPDATAYHSGRDEGLKRYCTAENGLHLGLAGSAYAEVCPPALEPAFLPRYQLGSAVYHARHELKRIKQDLADEKFSLSQKTEPAEIRDEQREISKLKNQLQASERGLAEIEICISSDARQSGFAFASHGYPYSTALTNSCLAYKVEINAKQFLAGWQEGNSEYCSYNSGKYAGQHQLDYLGACKGELHHHFFSGYQAGLEIARHESEMRELERKNRATQLERQRREAEAAKARERALEQQLLQAHRKNEANKRMHDQHGGPRYPVTPMVAQNVRTPQAHRPEHERGTQEKNKHHGSEVDADIAGNEKELAGIEREIKANERALARKNISIKERQAILKRQTELSREQQQMAERLQRLKRH